MHLHCFKDESIFSGTQGSAGLSLYCNTITHCLPLYSPLQPGASLFPGNICFRHRATTHVAPTPTPPGCWLPPIQVSDFPCLGLVPWYHFPFCCSLILICNYTFMTEGKTGAMSQRLPSSQDSTPSAKYTTFCPTP